MPTRYGRMLASPFAFYRGGALIMATDLSRTPNSGIRAQLCGDAHLQTSARSPAGADPRLRRQRLRRDNAGTVEVGCEAPRGKFRNRGPRERFSKKEREAAVLATTRSYREAMTGFGDAQPSGLVRRLPMEQALRDFNAGTDPKRLKKAEANVANARTRVDSRLREADPHRRRRTPHHQ